ncbi:MAG TPA: hypothetical protein DCY79_14920 [Planctomycetaceae bacterium]|nr:hypothetical protein [Blastopirellula sp.]HAY81095.1 hypothetical protein [Planctomycetaceae bacterium]
MLFDSPLSASQRVPPTSLQYRLIVVDGERFGGFLPAPPVQENCQCVAGNVLRSVMIPAMDVGW